MKNNVVTKFDHEVWQIPISSYEEYRVGLRTEAVNKATNMASSNRVLGCQPPNINPMEKCLLRTARSILSQLRSGFSRVLNNYKARIEKGINDIWPNCNGSPHDTNHLFKCPAKPNYFFHS